MLILLVCFPFFHFSHRFFSLSCSKKKKSNSYDRYDLSTPNSKKELYAYLERSCYTRQWSPGKTFLGFNITASANADPVYGAFSKTSHLDFHTLKGTRQLIEYDGSFHSHRAVYFPGHDANRMLTHFYGYLFFADINVHRFYLRFVRDRMLYLDSILVLNSLFSSDLY